MLSVSNLGRCFWVEVVGNAFYLINRSPYLSLIDKSPYEVWTSRKTLIVHLRVFGCETFLHAP